MKPFRYSKDLEKIFNLIELEFDTYYHALKKYPSKKEERIRETIREYKKSINAYYSLADNKKYKNFAKGKKGVYIKYKLVYIDSITFENQPLMDKLVESNSYKKEDKPKFKKNYKNVRKRFYTLSDKSERRINPNVNKANKKFKQILNGEKVQFDNDFEEKHAKYLLNKYKSIEEIFVLKETDLLKFFRVMLNEALKKDIYNDELRTRLLNNCILSSTLKKELKDLLINIPLDYEILKTEIKPLTFDT